MRKIIIGIITGIIASVVSSIILAIFKIIKWNDIRKLLNLLVTFFNFKISIGAIIVIIIIITIIFLLTKIIKNSNKKIKYPEWYYKFKELDYKEWHFVWNYSVLYYSKFDINNLRPICECGCNLVSTREVGRIHYNVSKLNCPNCNKIYNKPTSEDYNRVRVLIEYQINNFKSKAIHN